MGVSKIKEAITGADAWLRASGSRRTVLAVSGITAFSLLQPDSGAAQPSLELSSASLACAKTPDVSPPKPEQAVSMRRLLEAKTGPGARLPSLTRLDGYVQTTDDLILWGRRQAGEPELHLDDVIVAFRTSLEHLRSAYKYKGERPAISIDPVDSSMDAAMAVNTIDSRGRDRFRELCAMPQKVRVDGMPRNTRLAKVLVDADYRMKQVGQGSVKLPIRPALIGPFETRWAQRGQRPPGSSVSTRYWFHAGQSSYQRDEYTVYLENADVVLSTEDQARDRNQGSGAVDPIAQQYVCQWTSRMEEIAAAEPIWRDMLNVFRSFAIASALAKETAGGILLGKALAALIDEHVVGEVPLPDSVPGLSRWEQARGRETKGNQRFDVTTVSKVCGGVAVGFGRNLQRSAQTMQPMRSVDHTILSARPDAIAISWPVGELRERPAHFRSTYSSERSTREATSPSQSASGGGGLRIPTPFILSILGFGAIALFRMMKAGSEQMKNSGDDS
jgi:hypothetical protein